MNVIYDTDSRIFQTFSWEEEMLGTFHLLEYRVFCKSKIGQKILYKTVKLIRPDHLTNLGQTQRDRICE
jgi:hypothetical protein